MEYFERDEDFVKADLDPDAVVARGAGRIARKFHPTPHKFDITNRPGKDLVDSEAEEELGTHQLITEHSLGVGVQDNRVVRIVGNSTHIPVSVRRGGFANLGPSPDLEARVFQGEGEFIWENDLMGIVHLGPMEPKPSGHHKFEITFAIDLNGMLSVTVHHLNEGKDYTERFEEKTAVADSDLSRRYKKLDKMYGDLEPEPELEVPPPPPPVPQEPPVAEEPSSPSDPTPPGAVPPATEPIVPGASGSEELLDPEGGVPQDFARLVRRTKKHLLRSPDPALTEAYNRFVTALNAGQDKGELEELGDDLEDAYFDSRSRSG